MIEKLRNFDNKYLPIYPPIMISGKVAEDELFDLPARGRPTRQIKKMRKIPSFDRASLDRNFT